jgi:hypothetical protein
MGSTGVEMLATIPPMPEPDDVPDTDRARHLLLVWRQHMDPLSSDGSGDREDFWEMAARLDAALSTGAARVWLADPRRDYATDTSTGAHRPVTDLYDLVAQGRMLHWGPLTRMTGLNRIVDTRANRYHRAGAFWDNAGRTCLLAGFRADGLEVGAAMSQLARAGHTEAVVKDTRPKHGLWRLPVADDDADNEEVLSEAAGWGMVHAEGLPDAFLVQEVVPMVYEYRVFIVDGRPVTGAGCIEEHTPLDAVEGVPFSPLVRAGRVSADGAAEGVGPVLEQPRLVDRFVEFAARVAAQAEREGSMPDAYVVDVAQAPSGPVVIEMNGVTNAGLYASDPRLVVQALVNAARASVVPAGRPT